MGKHNKNKNDQGFSRSDYLKHPGQFAKPLTGKNFKHELKSMRRLEFGPQMKELKSEKRASNLQQQRIGNWFNQYQQQVGRLNSNVTGAYNQAVQGAQQDTNATSAFAEKLRQRVAAQGQQSAALRGANYSTAPDQQAAQANIARRQSADSTTGMIRAQGANEHAYFADKKRIGKGEEISQLLQEAARGRQTNQDIKSLNADKQAFTDKFLHDSRAQEQNFYLGLLQAQLGNKQAKLSAQTSRSNALLSAKTSRQNSKRTAASSAASRKQSRKEFNKTHTASGKSKGTVGSSSNKGHSHQHEQQRAVQHILTQLQAHTKNGHIVDSKGHRMSKAQIKAAILGSSQSYNKHEYHQALKKWKHKQLGKNVSGTVFP